MKQIVVDPRTYFFLEGKTTLMEIEKFADITIGRLMEEAGKAGVKQAGPLEFIYFGAGKDPEKSFTLQVAIPLKNTETKEEDQKLKSTDRFKCLSYTYKGSMSGLAGTYETLFEHIWNNSLRITDEIREIYHVYNGKDSAENVTEIQIGLL